MILFENKPENAKIRETCKRLICSSRIIKKIMASRCKFKTKMQMIKYIEAIRCNIN